MIKTVVPMFAAALLLAACGENGQISSSSPQADQQAWQATGSRFNATNYNGSDKAAWDTQMGNRIKVQNEYNRIK